LQWPPEISFYKILYPYEGGAWLDLSTNIVISNVAKCKDINQN